MTSRTPGPVQLEPPREVRDIARRLEDAGHETWCVGGAVRDALLGLPHLDWDLATAATPPQVRGIFRRTVAVGEAFGTIGVLDPSGRLHEVTTFRHDVQTDGRHAVVAFGASLDEDLARRDFTINAMAWSPSARRLHDPYGGQADLAAGVIRAVGDPPQRMAEDRLRALRALRFAGRFGFRIEPATWASIVDSAPALHRLSRERVQQELVKTLEQVRCPGASLRLWEASGALRELLPALAGRDAWHLAAADHRAQPERTRDAGIARRRTLVRLGALLGGLSFRDATELLSGLRFSNRDVQRTARLVEVAAAIDAGLDADPVPADATLRRWAAQARRVDAADAVRVALAVRVARAPGSAADGAARRSTYRRLLRCAWRDPVEIADLAVDGEDLVRRAGVPPGPLVGEVLRVLLDRVLIDPAANRDEVLIEAARAHVAALGQGAP